MNEKAYLVLENGRVFTGKRFGAPGAVQGELVFDTNMVGYIETLTDPCYSNQLIVRTFPMLGNYGVDLAAFDKKCYPSACIVREFCLQPSNFKADKTIDEFMKAGNVVGLAGIDTREITSIIRDYGPINAMICDELPDDMDSLKSFHPSYDFTPLNNLNYTPEGTPLFRLAIINFGDAERSCQPLIDRNCSITVLPAQSKAEDILALDIDGIILSDGPGNPEEHEEHCAEIAKLLGKKPLFGMGLGHCLLAKAAGNGCIRLKNGHHGSNQPVKSLENGRVYITTQNHEWAVNDDALAKGAVSFRNVNDSSCQGVNYPDLQAFSVQFRPVGGGGPNDTCFVFDKLISLMGGSADATE